jgi:hypothetical protein
MARLMPKNKKGLPFAERVNFGFVSINLNQYLVMV